MERPLKEGEGGPYGDLAGRPLPDGLVLVFMPSLAALPGRAEQLKGSPLTEEQVLRVRDAATVVVTGLGPAAAVAEGRGHADADPANPWESWQAIRGGSASTPEG
jgi:hypothetical protein